MNGEEGEEIPSVTRSRDGETVGFECVPGAGDDDELWGRVSALDCLKLIG